MTFGWVNPVPESDFTLVVVWRLASARRLTASERGSSLSRVKPRHLR